jgi:hypothetical protein
MDKPEVANPLAEWPTFAARVEARLELGRSVYGDRSFSADPQALLTEIETELLDLAGWGFVLWSRLQTIRAALERGGEP